MLFYLILNGIYRSYLLADGYETARHFFEGLTAYCKIQVRMGSGREGGFLPTSCSDARVAETSLNFSVFLPHFGEISPYFGISLLSILRVSFFLLPAKLHPNDVRTGVLRDADRGAVVGPVQIAALAGLPRNLRSGAAQGCQGGGVFRGEGGHGCRFQLSISGNISSC